MLDHRKIKRVPEKTSTFGFPGGSEVKASARNAKDLGLIPGSGSSPGEGNGNPLQYSCPENPKDGGAWWATFHGVAKRWTRLSDFTSLCFINYAKAFDCVDHNKLWRIQKEMGIPDHLTYLLRNLYAGQEVRTGHGTRLVPNWERSSSRLYIVTQLI